MPCALNKVILTKVTEMCEECIQKHDLIMAYEVCIRDVSLTNVIYSGIRSQKIETKFEELDYEKDSKYNLNHSYFVKKIFICSIFVKK